MVKWFRRVADIPGVSYTPNYHIDRINLVGNDFVPEVSAIEFAGKQKEILSWPSENGHGTITSPAGNRRALIVGDVPASDILRNLYECMELPGEPADYHFMLQGCAEVLLKCGRAENILTSDMEWLCKLDISLVQAFPDAVIPIWDPEQRPTSILCFEILIHLYERQGRVREALEIAEIASTFDECKDTLLRLRNDITLAKPEMKDGNLHLTEAIPQVNDAGRIVDWGFRPGEEDGALGGAVARWYYWWSDSHQERFNRLWSAEGDRVADDLADQYGAVWPWLIGEALATAVPAIYERLVEFSASVHGSGSYGAHASHPESIATWGAFHITRKRRAWRLPAAAICPACDKDFWDGDVKSWAVQRFGPVRYCMNCCLNSINGNPQLKWSKDEIIQGIRELCEAFGVIPQQQFARAPIPFDATPDKRDRWMRALVAMPNVDIIKKVLEQKDWLGVLQTAELVGETWRPGRGTWCRANDGHRCRSLLEKSIDDWLSSNNIDHECEPRWPRHSQFNPSGAKRADWLLPDGTYVECAGMMDDPEYAAKIVAKRQLAQELEIPLVVIGPTDMHRLDRILAAHVPTQ